MSTTDYSKLQLAPLGAGDHIDRAVRLYRSHLFVLIQTASPPMIIVAAGWIILSIYVRDLFQSASLDDALYYFLLSMIGFGIIFLGYLFVLIVMGGAARTLVAHLLRNDPVSMRATYTAVRSRFWSLLAASLIILLVIMCVSSICTMVLYFVSVLVLIVSVLIATALPTAFSVLFGVITFLIGLAASTFLFFFVVGFVAYVPQVMLVEGKSLIDSFGRSITLARGNVRRLMAMTLFTTFATQSALVILIVPLGWIGYIAGIDLWNSAQWPAWYAVSYSVLGPVSSILLTPVWMLGLSLLYVDERVRHEGYDIELLAARYLGEVPDSNVASPLGPALAVNAPKPPPPPVRRGILNLG
jgi:hypothetical protein